MLKRVPRNIAEFIRRRAWLLVIAIVVMSAALVPGIE